MSTGVIQWTNVQVMDVSAEGISVQAPRDVPRFEMGQIVLLRIEHADVESPPSVQAVVRHWFDIDDGRIYGLRFIDWQKLHRRLPPGLYELFNRRNAFRVAIPSTDHISVRVTVLTNGRRAEGRLIDISANSVCIDVEKPARLEESERVIIRFLLPPSGDNVELTGVVRREDQRTDPPQYGIEFDRQASRHFDSQQQQIIYYIQMCK